MPLADIDGRDRVDVAVAINHHKARQPVDLHLVNGRGHEPAPARYALEEANDLVAAIDGIERCRALAAAVGIENGIRREHLGELCRITAHDGTLKRIGEPRHLLLWHAKARPRVMNMGTSARRQLPAGTLSAVEHF